MFQKFPSIEQFRNVIKQVHDHCNYNAIELPIIKFNGTVKLHGTNSAIGFRIDTGEVFYQSRERIITPEDDNYGFSGWASGSTEVSELLELVRKEFKAERVIHIFGEWAGKGIQKDVAIAEFQKSFYIFGIMVDDQFVELPRFFDTNFNSIFFINQFPMFEIEIDFNNPGLVQNRLIELTLEVEDECPVSKSRGISGLGEGIVWVSDWEGNRLAFKSKGQKHSNSKVKTLKQIAEVDVQEMESINEFVENTVSENRLNQGIEKLKEMGMDPNDIKSLGDFLRWIVGDILREERDIIEKSGLTDNKALNKKITEKSRKWFINRIDGIY